MTSQLPQKDDRPGLIASFLRGPADKTRRKHGLARWWLFPVMIIAAAIDGAHRVTCPSQQALDRKRLAQRMAGEK